MTKPIKTITGQQKNVKIFINITFTFFLENSNYNTNNYKKNYNKTYNNNYEKKVKLIIKIITIKKKHL